MPKDGPIIVIEDDADDQDIFRQIFKNLQITNEVKYFADGEEAFEYLTTSDESPFVILSDVNMPKLNGFQLRSRIHTDQQLHLKCIPFLFFSTNANKQSVADAYAMSVQGFFIKPTRMEDWQRMIKRVVEYWQDCIAPGQFE